MWIGAQALEWSFKIFSIFGIILISQFINADFKEICPQSSRALSSCPSLEQDYAAAISSANLNGRKVVLLFGSNYCGPCRTWKKALQNDKSLGSKFDVLLIPLPSRESQAPTDRRYVKFCNDLYRLNRTGTAGLPSEISSVPACRRKPTMVLFDPKRNVANEIDPTAKLSPAYISKLEQQLSQASTEVTPSDDTSSKDSETFR